MRLRGGNGFQHGTKLSGVAVDFSLGKIKNSYAKKLYSFEGSLLLNHVIS